MKTRSVVRIALLTVLTLILAVPTVPAAWAQPAETSGFFSPAPDLGSLLSWLQPFFGGWLGGGGQTADMESITGKAGQTLEPDGADLRTQTQWDGEGASQESTASPAR